MTNLKFQIVLILFKKEMKVHNTIMIKVLLFKSQAINHPNKRVLERKGDLDNLSIVF